MKDIVKFSLVIFAVVLFIVGCSTDAVMKIEENQQYQNTYSLDEIELLEAHQMEDFYYSEDYDPELSTSQSLDAKGYLDEGCSFFGRDRVEVKFLVSSNAAYPYYRMGWKYQDNTWRSTIVQRRSSSDTTSDKQRVMFWRDSKGRLRITVSVVYSYNGSQFAWGNKRIMYPIVNSCDSGNYILKVKGSDK